MAIQCYNNTINDLKKCKEGDLNSCLDFLLNFSLEDPVKGSLNSSLIIIFLGAVAMRAAMIVPDIMGYEYAHRPEITDYQQHFVQSLKFGSTLGAISLIVLFTRGIFHQQFCIPNEVKSVEVKNDTYAVSNDNNTDSLYDNLDSDFNLTTTTTEF